MATLVLVLYALAAVPAARAVHNPPITGRDTLRQLAPSRYPVPPYDEHERKPINYRPTITQTWMFNGRVRTSTHHQTTNKNFHTVSGRRVVQDRAGRVTINNNRTQLIRRRAMRDYW